MSTLQQNEESISSQDVQGISSLSAEEIQKLPPDVRQQILEAQQGGFSAAEAKALQKEIESTPQGRKMLERRKAEQGQTEEPHSRTGRSKNLLRSLEKGPAQEASNATQTKSTNATRAKPVVSRLERQYRQNYDSPLAKGLTQFGYDFFSQATLQPSKLAVPDDSYILGPGDELRIRLWGSSVDAQYTGKIAPDGTVNVPKIGIVPVAGVKLGQVESLIRKEAEKYVQGINIDVSMASLRSVEIYVVGAVKNPGLHTVPAFSTVLKGLIAASGVQKFGTLRKIHLYREGQLYKTVDMYDLLLHGSKDLDVSVQDRDVIFVPRIGPTAAVAGAVQEDGIFELKGKETVGDLFNLAGGVLPQGFTGRMLLRRYANHASFVVQDIDTERAPDNWRQTAVSNGDLLELRFMEPGRSKAVELKGHVRHPDAFAYHQGLMLSDVIGSPDVVKTGAVTAYGLVYRYNKASSQYEVHRFPLSKVWSGKYDMSLAPMDKVVVLSRQQMGIDEYVSIEGPVWKPGNYTYRPRMQLSGLLALSGGIKTNMALQDRAYVYRYDPQQADYVMQEFNLEAVMNGTADRELQAYDRVQILSSEQQKERFQVTISGAVLQPGSYRYYPGMKLQDLIALAGNLQYGALQGRVEISRQNLGQNQATTEHMTVDLNTAHQVALKPFDYVHVPKLQGAGEFKTVSVTGQVRYPGTYRIKDDENISDLIKRAGGYTEDAYFYGAEFTSEDAQKIQQESVDKMIQDLQIRLQQAVAETAQTAVSPQDVQAAKTGQASSQRIISELKQIKAKGRVAISLGPLKSFAGSKFDFRLSDGDSLNIPTTPKYVSVVGSVYSPSAYLYQPELSLGDYLDKSGGPTKTADEDHIYVLKANGEVVAKQQEGGWFHSFKSLDLMPGDTIVVPENLERVPYMRMVKDVTEIMFRIATTAGVALAL